MASRLSAIAARAGRPSRFCRAAASVVSASVLSCWAGGAFAQVTDPTQAFRTTGQPISAGRFFLYPSVTLDSGYNSNVFYQSEEVPGASLVSSGELHVTPKIMVDLPLSRSRVRFAYALQYRDYTSDEFAQKEPFSHFFDLEASTQVGESVTLAVREHYVQGTQQFDPGGELFGLVPFTLSEPAAELTLTFGGRHRLSVAPRVSNLYFDDEDQLGLYDYERRGLSGRYAYQLDPLTTVYTTLFHDETDQHRDTSFFGDVNVDTHYAGAGLQRAFGASIASSMSAGHETQDYEGGAGENFSGLVYDVNVTWTLSDVFHFEFGAARQPYQSFFVNNNYYVSNAFKLRMAQQIGRYGFWLFGVGLQRNPYADPVDIRVTAATAPEADLDDDGFIDVYESLLPSQGVLRDDRALIFELGAGLRFSPVLRLSVGYTHEARDSNMVQILVPGGAFEPFDFTVDRVFLRIEAGIL